MKILLLLFAALLLAACEQKTAPPAAGTVVVYAADGNAEYLAQLTAAFTRETGVPVTVRLASAAELTNDIIANRGSPPADVLLARNVAEVWRAADEGALRPVVAASMDGVAGFLRDPDGLWTAASMGVIVIAVGEGAAVEELPTSYAALGQPPYNGRLCLSSSSLPVNRALIAMLIDDLGTKPAERVVRGWIRNLALPVFETEEALVEALDAGSCSYGIVSSTQVTGGRILPEPAYVDAEVVGIARHARYPELAQTFVQWLLSSDVQLRHASDTAAHPALGNLSDAPIPASISRNNVGLAGWRDTEAVLLAERAGYR